MKTIAFDLGRSRTGVAVSDDLGILASPVKTIVKSDPEAILADAAAAVSEYGAAEAVVGLPLRTDGKDGAMAAFAREFADRLASLCSIPVKLCDERYSTVLANARYNEAGKKGALKRRKSIDSAAAAVILQGYLDGKK